MNRDGWASFVLGLGIGVGLGMIFAPKSGEETRELLKSKADEGADYLRKQTAGLRDSASELVEKGRDVVSRQAEVIRENLAEAVEAGRQAYMGEKAAPVDPTQAV